jgi:hypothetical protein
VWVSLETQASDTEQNLAHGRKVERGHQVPGSLLQLGAGGGAALTSLTIMLPHSFLSATPRIDIGDVGSQGDSSVFISTNHRIMMLSSQNRTSRTSTLVYHPKDYYKDRRGLGKKKRP